MLEKKILPLMKIVMERKLQNHRPLNRCKFSFLISIDLDEIKIQSFDYCKVHSSKRTVCHINDQRIAKCKLRT